MAKFVDCRIGILSRGAASARTHYQRLTIGPHPHPLRHPSRMRGSKCSPFAARIPCGKCEIASKERARLSRLEKGPPRRAALSVDRRSVIGSFHEARALKWNTASGYSAVSRPRTLREPKQSRPFSTAVFLAPRSARER